MTVYVDGAIHRKGRYRWCHMWSDDLAELHALAQALGKARSSFQAPPRAQWRHYDLHERDRERALVMGAVETDRYGAVEHVARLAGDVATLARIEALRERKALAAAAGS